jgi:hypothetical protein
MFASMPLLREDSFPPSPALVPSAYNDDIQSLLLAAALQLEEIEGLDTTFKGKARENAPVSDAQLALQAYNADTVVLKSYLEGLRFAQSLHSAISLDWELLEALSSQEAQAQEDRRIAIQLAQGRQSTASPSPVTSRNVSRRTSSSSLGTVIAGPSFTG